MKLIKNSNRSSGRYDGILSPSLSSAFGVLPPAAHLMQYSDNAISIWYEEKAEKVLTEVPGMRSAFNTQPPGSHNASRLPAAIRLDSPCPWGQFLLFTSFYIQNI